MEREPGFRFAVAVRRLWACSVVTRAGRGGLRARSAIAALAVLVAIALGCAPAIAADPAISAAPGSARGLNVLLITLDTARADKIGCYGCAQVKTPAIDALASKGVRFADAVSPVPITLPSHASIFTGLYPPRHGVRDNGTFALDAKHQSVAEILKDAGYATAAFLGAFVLDRRYGLDQGFDVYKDELAASRRHSGLRSGPPQRPGNVVADEALQWLGQHQSQESAKPFFAWVHLFDPHTPYTPPEPYATTYRAAPYLGEIAFADEQVGRLVAYLRGASLLDRTLVVVVGDHGEGLNDHDERQHSRLIYETTMAVPMIWHCPSLLGAPRVVSDRVVSLVDLAPTLCDLLGVPAPRQMDGRSLLGKQPSDRAVYMETLATQLNHGWSPLFGLRRHRDKYIEAPTPEYFNLEEDPGELVNLLAKAGDQARVLQQQLADLRTEFDAGADDLGKRQKPDAEALRKLAALGYVARPVGASTAGDGDPKVLIRLYHRYDSASHLHQAGRLIEASAIYRSIVKETPEDGSAWAALGACLREMGRLDEALEATLRAVELKPVDRYWVDLARVYLLQGKDEECETALQQMAAVDPKEGEIPLIRGERALRHGQHDKALALFEKARKLDPSTQSINAHVLTGWTLMQTGDKDKALLAYREAQYCDPNDPRALYGLVELEDKAGNTSAAAQHAAALCTLFPNEITHASRLAQLYLKLGWKDDALAALRAYTERRPKDPAGYGNLGNAYMESGQTDNAIAAYQRAIEIAPEYAYAHYNLANALLFFRDGATAVQHLQAAVQHRPDYVKAHRKLLQVLTKQGRIDEALTELERAVRYRIVDWDAMDDDGGLVALHSHPKYLKLRANAKP